MRTGGKCLYSFFVLDFYGGTGTSSDPLYGFDGRVPGLERVGVRDIERPAAVIAYERGLIEELAAQGGMRVERVIPGYWSVQSEYAVNEQDLVLLEAT
jgi:hypothetical protein